MEEEATLRRQGHGLLRVGSALFLLALLVGIAIPRFTVPRLGLSTHLLGVTQGIFLLVLGLVWPRLTLGPLQARVAHGLAIYGCLSPWTANLWSSGACGASASRQSVIFTKRLREGVRRGAITSSVRIWMRPHVVAGKRYRMDDGEIEIESILPIGLGDVTPELARESVWQPGARRRGDRIRDVRDQEGEHEDEDSRVRGHPRGGVRCDCPSG
jgi:hypothetical protein